jgi:hypothetical protein
MDIRQHDFNIDGRTLSSWFLHDTDTEMDVRTYFRFDDYVDSSRPTVTTVGRCILRT